MIITKKNEPLTLVGEQPKVGEQAPAFSLPNLSDQLVSLKKYAGSPLLISVVPDINTRVCEIQTKHFNHDAAVIQGVNFITISNNTKDEQKNWCAAAGITMEMLHDVDNSFGKAYGLYITEMKRLARAIFIIDKNGRIAYEEIVPEISHEPDYQTALEKAKALR